MKNKKLVRIVYEYSDGKQHEITTIPQLKLYTIVLSTPADQVQAIWQGFSSNLENTMTQIRQDVHKTQPDVDSLFWQFGVMSTYSIDDLLASMTNLATKAKIAAEIELKDVISDKNKLMQLIVKNKDKKLFKKNLDKFNKTDCMFLNEKLKETLKVVKK